MCFSIFKQHLATAQASYISAWKSVHSNPYTTFQDLGHGISFSNPDVAADILVQREIPEIEEVPGKSHSVIFVPDSFVFRELTNKVQ